MLSIGSFSLNPDLSKLTSQVLASTANSIQSGAESYLLLGSFSLRLQRSQLTVFSDTFTQNIAASEKQRVVDWLRELIPIVRTSNLGFFGAIPLELRLRALSFQSYDEILKTCRDVPELRDVCSNVNFWKQKAIREGIPEHRFGNPDNPAKKYAELSFHYSDVCYPGYEEIIEPEDCIRSTVRMGREDILDYFVELSSDKVDALSSAAFEAALKGDRKLVDRLLERGVNIVEAVPLARYGDRDIIERVLREFPNQIDDIIQFAARGNQVDLVEELIGGPQDVSIYRYAIQGFLQGGHIDSLREFVRKHPAGTSSLFSDPNSYVGDWMLNEFPLQSLDFLLSLGVTDLPRIFKAAAFSENTAVIEKLVSLPQLDRDEALIELLNIYTSAYDKSTDLQFQYLEMLLRAGVTNLNEALLRAVESSSPEVVTRIVEAGATNFGEAYEALRIYLEGDDRRSSEWREEIRRYLASKL